MTPERNDVGRGDAAFGAIKPPHPARAVVRSGEPDFVQSTVEVRSDVVRIVRLDAFFPPDCN
jgi:hypothetical protein